MKRSRSEAWEEFERDAQASGGGNTLRGIARIALTCFVEPMQKLQHVVDKLLDDGVIRRLYCQESECTANGIFYQYWLAAYGCDFMMICWPCGHYCCNNHGKIHNGHCICNDCARIKKIK